MSCANQIESSLVPRGTGLGIAGASPQHEGELASSFSAFESLLMSDLDPVLCVLTKSQTAL